MQSCQAMGEMQGVSSPMGCRLSQVPTWVRCRVSQVGAWRYMGQYHHHGKAWMFGVTELLKVELTW